MGQGWVDGGLFFPSFLWKVGVMNHVANVGLGIKASLGYVQIICCERVVLRVHVWIFFSTPLLWLTCVA